MGHPMCRRVFMYGHPPPHRAVYIPTLRKNAKDGAPERLWLVEIWDGGHPPKSVPQRLKPHRKQVRVRHG